MYYAKYIFAKDFLETQNLRPSLDQDLDRFDIFIQTTSIRKSRTQVLMERSVLDHCTIHKEGMMEYRIWLA